VCGEQHLVQHLYPLTMGSPPRVRGAVLSYNSKPKGLRITPACAGSSVRLQACGGRLQDHPRVCGEQAAAEAEGVKLSGSPPRVRGAG